MQFRLFYNYISSVSLHLRQTIKKKKKLKRHNKKPPKQTKNQHHHKIKPTNLYMLADSLKYD